MRKSHPTCHLDMLQTHTHFKGKMMKYPHHPSVSTVCVSPGERIKKPTRDSEHTALVGQRVSERLRVYSDCIRLYSCLYVCVCVLTPVTSPGALVRRFARLCMCAYVFVP